jgi:hypothetical protein
MSQAASVSDAAFTKEIWRHEEQGNVKVAAETRELWQHARVGQGYRDNVGPLTTHEIGGFAEKYLHGDDGDAVAFARAVERAALIKAFTLLPELRQAQAQKSYSKAYSNGMNMGLVTYSGAIRALAMGQAQGEGDDAKPVRSRKGSEIAQLEKTVDASAIRPKFEAWAGSRQFDLRQQSGDYTNTVTAYVWMGWLAAGMAQAQDYPKTAGAPQTCRSSEKVQVDQLEFGLPAGQPAIRDIGAATGVAATGAAAHSIVGANMPAKQNPGG